MDISANEIGKEIGVSSWLSLSQEDIDTFGKVTRDEDPYHMDPEWAKKNSPFKSTIAYGFHTLSLLSHFAHEIFNGPKSTTSSSNGMALNYGFEKVRFLAPVLVNARIRCRMTLIANEEVHPGEWLRTFDCVVEIEGSDKPALVAVWKGLSIEPGAGERLKTEE